MKKNLALILALVMLLSTVFAVVPMAAATEATPPAAASEYEPKISYANVNYSDKLYVMFAVPAPAADLGEGVEVNLLVWANKDLAEAYSFKDQNAIKLSAQAEKATIGDAQYLVFKYDALTAADMTNIIAARPVVLYNWEETVTTEIPEEKNEAGEVTKPAETKTEIVPHTDVVTYGDIVEYSVLEYVAAANGAFGAAALADDVLAMLNSMITFGGLAQKYSGKDYEFFASDELAKIWYVPVINGVEGAKVFGGFFKKGAELATVSAPHLDEYAFTSFIDAEGNAIYDTDGLATNGEQVLVAGEGALPLDENGDLVIKAKYDILYFYRPDANKATDSSTNLYEDKTGNKWTSDKGGLGINCGAGSEEIADFNYAALDVIDDPYQPGNKVYRIVGNTQHNIGPGNTTNDWKVSLKPSATPGFNDTIAPVISVEIVVGRGANGLCMTTGKIKLRSGSNGETAIGYLTKNGSFMLYTDGGNATPLPVKVAETGYTRYVFVVDFNQEAIFAFAAENADDELVYQGLTTHPEFSKKGKHFKENPWIEWGMTLDRLEWWGGKNANNFTAEEKNGGLLADLDGDGVGETPMMNSEGVTNRDAIRWCFENHRAMLVKEYCAYVGSPVAIPESFEMYNVDANSAVNATTKNSLDYVNNFGDEELVSKLGLPAGSTFGGLGTNFQSVAVANYVNYAGLDIIDDPYQTGNKVYSFNGTDAGVIWQAENIKTAGSKPAYTSSLKISTRAKGFFDGSIFPIITYDMVVGGNGTDRMLETDTIRFRGASSTYVHLFKIAADGSILVCKPNADYTDAEFGDTGVDVKLNGYTRIVASVDCANEVFNLYAGDEGAALQLIATIDTLWITSTNLSHSSGESAPKAKTFTTWMDMAKALDRTEIMIDDFGANALTEAELANLSDAAAVQAYCRQNRVLLIKDWDTYLGAAK